MGHIQLEVIPEFIGILLKEHGENKLSSTLGHMDLNNIDLLM